MNKQEVNRYCAELLYPDAEININSPMTRKIVMVSNSSHSMDDFELDIYTNTDQLCQFITEYGTAQFFIWCDERVGEAVTDDIIKCMQNFCEACAGEQS